MLPKLILPKPIPKTTTPRRLPLQKSIPMEMMTKICMMHSIIPKMPTDDLVPNGQVGT